MSFRQKSLMTLQHHGQAILVTVVGVKGSTPREAGAQMLVTSSGFLGSIGGGTLEWQAMAQAQAMLSKGINQRNSDFTLGSDLGQCCGGRVSLNLQRFERGGETGLAAAMTLLQPRRRLFVFGAGHVGRALVLVLAQSEMDVLWVDPRPQAFPDAVPGNVQLHNDSDALTALDTVVPGSLVLVMSHSHELDFAIVDKALRQTAVARLGLIGSATKRARFLSRLLTAGHSEARLEDFICPIGNGEITSKLPYAIAISTAAQLLALDETLCVSHTEALERIRKA